MVGAKVCLEWFQERSGEASWKHSHNELLWEFVLIKEGNEATVGRWVKIRKRFLNMGESTVYLDVNYSRTHFVMWEKGENYWSHCVCVCERELVLYKSGCDSSVVTGCEGSVWARTRVGGSMWLWQLVDVLLWFLQLSEWWKKQIIIYGLKFWWKGKK